MICTCGSKNFEINEGIVWGAVLDEKGILKAIKPKTSEIEVIYCASCGKEYTEKDFNDVKFREND